MKRLILPFLAFVFLVISCQKEELIKSVATPTLPQTHYNYEGTTFPLHMGGQNINDIWGMEANPISDAGATLGRVLFYDTKLSINNSTSCGSCHNQHLGFAEPTRFSTGFETLQTPRNSQHFANLLFQSTFFWDERAHVMEEQVMMPIENHIEMGMENFEFLAEKLQRVDYYEPLFQEVYGNSEVTPERIKLALAQFVKSVVSFDSKYDQGVGTDFANFNALEKMGFELFFNELHCGSCHSGQNLAGWGSSNIGLDENYSDGGRGGDNPQSPEHGFFKIPSLRNVALTAPYMHDGRFATLEEVIEHYNSSVVQHQNIDFRLTDAGWGSGGPSIFPAIDPLEPFNNQGISNSFDDLIFPVSAGNVQRLNLTSMEKQALVAFLETLTDHTMISDPKFSDPFN